MGGFWKLSFFVPSPGAHVRKSFSSLITVAPVEVPVRAVHDTHVHNGTFVKHSPYDLHAATDVSHTQRPISHTESKRAEWPAQVSPRPLSPCLLVATAERVRLGLSGAGVVLWLDYRHSHPPRCAPRPALVLSCLLTLYTSVLESVRRWHRPGPLSPCRRR